MKSWYGVWVFLVFFGIAAGNAASAPDAPQNTVVSQGTGTNTASEGPQVAVKFPLFSPLFDDVPLAMVNEDPITTGELVNALAAAHEERDSAEKQVGKMEYRTILDRLINMRLLIEEAKTIGLDELPEFKEAVDGYSPRALAEILMKDVTKDVKEADPAAVEKLYKEMVVEWKIKSLFFEKEEDAKSMADAIKAGKSFDELAEKAVAEKKVSSVQEGNYVKPKDLAPHIMEAVASMKVGSVSPILNAQAGKTQGFTILKLEDTRYPEDPKAREKAEQAVLNAKKSEAWEKYKEDLLKKHVKIHDKFLNNLDLHSSKVKFTQLMKDKRVVADIKGEKPITVGDLINALREKHYHGLEQAAKSKKLNKDKRLALFQIISKRVLEKAVAEQEIARREEYQKGLKEFQNTTLFGLFAGRVVYPDVKVTEQDLTAYFEDHKNEYQYPEMIKITSLAFGNKGDAEFALGALKKGADLAWVRNNAEGIVVETDDDDLLSMNGSVLATNTLPPDMAKTVAGAHTGDYRLYEDPKGRFYVLSVQEIIPPRQQPYEDVREMISQKVFSTRFAQSMEDWFVKLRAAYTVKLYLADTGK